MGSWRGPPGAGEEYVGETEELKRLRIAYPSPERVSYPGVPGYGGEEGIDLTADQAIAIDGEGLSGVAPVGFNGFRETLPAITGVVTGEMPVHQDIMFGELGYTVNDVPISGPGVPEPPKSMIAKEWHVKFQSEKYGTFQMFYWRLIDGRCLSYHSPTKTWKIWRPKKHIVISRDPRVSTLRKLGRLNKRVEKMLRPFQPKGKGFPAKALARTYLSTAEKKLLKGAV